MSTSEAGFIWSRLILQTSDMMAFTALDGDTRAALASAAQKAAINLTGCYGAYRRVAAYQDRVLREWKTGGSQFHPQPLLDDLTLDIRSFLYDAKSTLRDATGILAVAFNVKMEDASDFYRGKTERCRALNLLTPRLGKTHPLLRDLVQAEEGWLAELIRMRNAVEHPGGHSGVVEWDNFEFSKGGVRLPQWGRVPTAPEPAMHPTPIAEDMETVCILLLEFCEGLMIHALRHHLRSPLLRILADPAATAWNTHRRFGICPAVPEDGGHQ